MLVTLQAGMFLLLVNYVQVWSTLAMFLHKSTNLLMSTSFSFSQLPFSGNCFVTKGSEVLSSDSASSATCLSACKTDPLQCCGVLSSWSALLRMVSSITPNTQSHGSTVSWLLHLMALVCHCTCTVSLCSSCLWCFKQPLSLWWRCIWIHARNQYPTFWWFWCSSISACHWGWSFWS